MLDSFSCYFSLLTFSKLAFSKKSFRNTIRVSKGFDPDILSVLNWVQTGCIGYHQRTKFAASKDLVKLKEIWTVPQTLSICAQYFFVFLHEGIRPILKELVSLTDDRYST